MRTVRWWWVLVFAILSAGATWAATSWLLAVAGSSATLRVEAIKAGLAVAAGTGGASALLLATRRQWLNERAQLHREDVDRSDQAHQKLLAEINELDARERRITDLYAKAVDQLGSAKAPVRLGGLYALERLAEVNLNQRQTIVKVICAYLRMPFTPPARAWQASDSERASLSDFAVTSEADEELQVRQTAQSILTAHLRTHDGELYWEVDELNLAGATLVHCEMAYCSLPEINLKGASFFGRANFTGTLFKGLAIFEHTRFIVDPGMAEHAAEFTGSAFHSWADFSISQSTGGTMDFAGATFDKSAKFTVSEFDHIGFWQAAFRDDAAFYLTHFKNGASFAGTEFAGKANFQEVTFSTDSRVMPAAEFKGAKFADEPNFAGATISVMPDQKKTSGLPPTWTTQIVSVTDSARVENVVPIP